MKIFYYLFIFTLLASCDEGLKKTEGNNQKEIPHLLKDPYIKMLGMCGEWNVTFKVKSSVNKRHVEKIIKENWLIKNESNRLTLYVKSGNTKGWSIIKTFSGEISGDKLTMEGEKFNTFFMYEINIIDENELEGTKSVIFPDPANIDYTLKAKKII